MKVSDQIISVLNAICEKFGIVVDWTAQNVLPYMQDLCGRIVTFSIAKSIAWIVFEIVLLLMSFFAFKFFLEKSIEDEWCSEGWCVASIVSGILFGMCGILCLIGIPADVMNIIQACTIPELTIIEMVEGFIESKG